MKKIFLITLMILLVGSAPAFALTLVTTIDVIRAGTTEEDFVGPSGFLNSGSLVGVFTGNDSNQQDELQSWLRTDGGFGSDFILDEYFKDEFPDDGAATSGEWSTDAAILFYVVKAADAFALYEVIPTASSGTWSTYDLWIRGYGGNGGVAISHLSGYNGTAAVPEPATMLLLGTGLLGIAGMSRKRFKRS